MIVCRSGRYFGFQHKIAFSDKSDIIYTVAMSSAQTRKWADTAEWSRRGIEPGCGYRYDGGNFQ